MPDAPISLINNAELTSNLKIGLTWSNGVSNGGSAVLDYSVYYDQGTDNFVLLNNAVTSPSYLTTVTLTAGTTYKFKVTARNSVGTSSFSDPVSILAARVPDSPTNL